MFVIDELDDSGVHRWAVMNASCDLMNTSDPLVCSCATAIREAYGLEWLKASIANPDPDVASRFDLENVLRAFNIGLPDPSIESKKPPQLANYRSEAIEILAKQALAAAHGIQFLVHPQIGKTNPNQPVLGFDGWGIKGSALEGYSFVLVQVKGTDDPNRPPKEADKLAEECAAIPNQISAICRALTILAVIFRGKPEATIFLSMLDGIGRGRGLSLIIAPAIVRGITKPAMKDLSSIQTACDAILPMKGHGISISIGIQLNDFGQKVISLARAS